MGGTEHATSGYLRVIDPGINPKNLEILLKHLKQPTYASLHLDGAFPSDALEQPSKIPQLSEIYQVTKQVEVSPLVIVKTGGKLHGYSGLSVILEAPPADLILRIHGNWYKQKEKSIDKEIIEVSDVGWDLGDGAEVRVRPNYFDIAYLTYKDKEEPSSISDVRSALSGTNMRFERLNLNKQSKR